MYRIVEGASDKQANLVYISAYMFHFFIEMREHLLDTVYSVYV